MIPEIMLPHELTKKYLERIPKEIRDYEHEAIIERLNISSGKKFEMIVANYYDTITQYRKDDLTQYRTLLEEEIPDDYVIEKAADILRTIDYDTIHFDYDEPLIDDLSDTIEIIDTISTMLKANRTIKQRKSKYDLKHVYHYTPKHELTDNEKEESK